MSKYSATIRTAIPALLVGTLIVLAVPPLKIAYDEYFVDPFARSIWALRISNTKYLAEVRAELEIDGEPLLLERKIRCYKPVDYKYYSNIPQESDVLYNRGQMGDTLAGTTSKGRLFAINAPDVCTILALQSDAPPKTKAGKLQAEAEAKARAASPIQTPRTFEPRLLSKGELNTPVVYEIHGGRAATQVDAYVARDLLREGYHGVKLKEVSVKRIEGETLLQDWTDYDWFGGPTWYRHRHRNNGLYAADYIVALPEATWPKIEELLHEKGMAKERIEAAFGHYASIQQDEASPFDPQLMNYFWDSILTPFYGNLNSISYMNLRLPKSDIQAWREKGLSFFKSIIPCRHKDDGKEDVLCNEMLTGVIQFHPYEAWLKRGPRKPRYHVNGFSFQSFDMRTGYLRYMPRVYYKTTTDEESFVGQ